VRKAEPGTIKEKQAQMLRGKPARTGEREQECEEQGVLGRQFNSHESNCSAGNVNSKQQRVSQIVDEHGRDNHFWLPPVQTRTSAD
jgi:hypothetical protein